MSEEEVLCVKKVSVPLEWLKTECAVKCSFGLFKKITESMEYCFVERKSVEKDFTLKQIIPYCIVSDAGGNYACYPRAGSEARLHGLYSIGAGGHINRSDLIGNSIAGTVINGLCRELREEFSGIRVFPDNLQLLGIINEEYSEVGKAHLGIVFILKVDIRPNPGKELEGLKWENAERIRAVNLELWSKLAISLIE